MQSMSLELPWPPSLNHYKDLGRIIKTRNGKIYQIRKNSQETIAYYWQVVAIKKQYNKENEYIFPKDDLEITIELYPPSNRKYDIDNRLKVLFDSLVRSGIIKDDEQINRLHVQKMGIIPKGKVIMTITRRE